MNKTKEKRDLFFLLINTNDDQSKWLSIEVVIKAEETSTIWLYKAVVAFYCSFTYTHSLCLRSSSSSLDQRLVVYYRSIYSVYYFLEAFYYEQILLSFVFALTCMLICTRSFDILRKEKQTAKARRIVHNSQYSLTKKLSNFISFLWVFFFFLLFFFFYFLHRNFSKLTRCCQQKGTRENKRTSSNLLWDVTWACVLVLIIIAIVFFLFLCYFPHSLLCCWVGIFWTDRDDTNVFYLMYIFIGLTYAISSLHVILALMSIILGIISQSREPVWMAHSISPLWSGVFVRISFDSIELVLLYLFVLVRTMWCHWNHMCTPKRSLCGK